jgi:hypothetical protein
MSYKIRKQSCEQSDGDSGDWVLSYADKSGRKHRACHTSKKKAKGQIAAIEMRREAEESSNESLIECFIRELINEEIETTKKGDSMKEQRMRVTERQLRRMIRETLQREGFMDSVKGALGIGGGKKLKSSDLQSTFNALRDRGATVGKEILKLIDRGQRPSDADEGAILSKGILEVACIRVVRTVLDHALQAMGERGSGERPYENPWMVNEQGTGLEWRDLSSSDDPFAKALKFYQDAIRNKELVTSGNSLADAKAMAYLAALGENDIYVNERLKDVILAILGGRNYNHKEPMIDSVQGHTLRTLRATYQEWRP